MAKPKQKIVGWAMNRGNGKVSYITVVAGPDREAACRTLEALGYTVEDPREVQPVTIVKGHGVFPDVPIFDFHNREPILPKTKRGS